MGVFDVAKAMNNARKMKNQMSKIQAAGKGGMISMLLNGVNDLDEVEVNRDELYAYLEPLGVSRDTSDKLAKRLEDNIKEAYGNTKKNLEKEMVKSANMDDLKSMLGM